MAAESRSESAPDGRRGVLSVANSGPQQERTRVVQDRGETISEAVLTLEPGETASLSIPEGSGSVRVQLYASGASATTSFDPEVGSAFVTISGGSVLVGHL